MSIITKILLIAGAILLVSVLGFVAYKSHQLSQQQDAINKSIVEFKQLQGDIARSQAQYVTKDDLESFAKQNNVNIDAIKKDLATLNATVSGVNHIVITTPGSIQTNIPSTSTTPNPNPTVPTVECNGTQIPCPNADPFGFMRNQQHLMLGESFGSNLKIPIGEAGFSAWQKDPWAVTIYPRTYSVTNVLGTDEDGRHYVYNKFSIKTNGTEYPVQITDAKFEEEYPSPSFSFWNPRLFIGADVGVNVSHLPVNGEFAPGVHLGIMSYGKNKNTPDWSFVQIGVGYGVVSRNVQFQISPAQYNIGQHLPLIKNTYIGPVVGVGINGDVSVGIGMRVGL